MNSITFIIILCVILSFTLADLPKLPNGGNPIVRTKECKYSTKEEIGDCNNHHFSENLNNEMKCPIGTKAWPLMFPWEIKYQFADGKNAPNPPDGLIRYVYTINGITPGPTIHAIKGDWVLIPVTNNIMKPNLTGDGFHSEFLTIHWHGMSMRSVERQTISTEGEKSGTPFMDGVPGINQCPIPGYDQPDKNRFDYFFQYIDSGTYWYHSHYGVQLADGLVGPMIVKDCDDVKRFNYTEVDDWNDNIVIAQDWYERPSEDILIDYMKTDTTNWTTTRTKHAVPIEKLPTSGLIGGTKFNDCTKNATQCIPRPYKIFNFTFGKTYRLRLISMTIMSMLSFTIDNHKFEIIEVDGMLVNRNVTFQNDSFRRIPINTAQRYSILVKADQPIDNYWMRFDFPKCFRDNKGVDTTVNAKAIVRYDTAKVVDPTTTPVPVPNDSCTDLDVFALIPLCDKESDHKYDLFCDYKAPSKVKYNFTMDIIIDAWEAPIPVDKKDGWEQYFFGYVANKAHGIAPYADHHFSNVLNNTFLEVVKIKDNGPHEWDSLMNAYNIIDRNSIVDILFSNADTMEHPIHLHGHFFYVLGWGKENTNYSESLLNQISPIQRDVATVPSLGWLKIRFSVDNPGVWPMHCHIDWHVAIGMLAQFVEMPRNATNIYNQDGNKAPHEWCELCSTTTDNQNKYCANKLI